MQITSVDRSANHINHVVERRTGRPVTKWWRHGSQSGYPEVPSRIVGFDCRHRDAIVQDCSSDGVNFPVSRSRRETRARGGHRRHTVHAGSGSPGRNAVFTLRTQISRICDHRSLRISCSDAREHATQRRKSEPKPRRSAATIIRGLMQVLSPVLFESSLPSRQEYSDLFRPIHLVSRSLQKMPRQRSMIRQWSN